MASFNFSAGLVNRHKMEDWKLVRERHQRQTGVLCFLLHHGQPCVKCCNQQQFLHAEIAAHKCWECDSISQVLRWLNLGELVSRWGRIGDGQTDTIFGNETMCQCIGEGATMVLATCRLRHWIWRLTPLAEAAKIVKLLQSFNCSAKHDDEMIVTTPSISFTTLTKSSFVKRVGCERVWCGDEVLGNAEFNFQGTGVYLTMSANNYEQLLPDLGLL